MAGNSDQALMQERNRSSSIGAMGLMGFLLEWRQALEPVVVARGDAARTEGVRAGGRRRHFLEFALASAAFGALMLGCPAIAADLPIKAPQLRPAFDWSGFYVGGHLGYGRGHADVDVTAPGLTGWNKPLGSMFAGLHVGYNHFLASGLMLGAEADMSFPNFLNADEVAWSRTTAQGDLVEKIDYVGRLRGRIGYAFNPFLVYATGGFAWSQARFVETSDLTGFEDKALRIRTGFTVGAGVEVPIAPDWSARLEYLYDRFGSASAALPSGARADTSLDLHSLRLGLNWHLPQSGRLSGSAASFAQPVIDPNNWNIHGQYTFIGQGYPSFRSPYQGANSLAGSKQAQNTQSATAFVGVRLWEGAEFYINPELMQGFGLSDVHGLAGFSNGEAQKSSFPSPRLNVARAFVRQTFGLGGEQEIINDGPNQLGGKQDISRITVTAGKFAVTDAFNGNAYANDPRTTFLNWNIYGGGSFDWTMDKLSWTWGAFVDFNQKNWAFRTGYFLLPTTSNANSFDTHIPDRGQYTAELEFRYSLVRPTRQAAAVRLDEPWHDGRVHRRPRTAAGKSELSRHNADAPHQNELRIRRQLRAGGYRRPRPILARDMESRENRNRRLDGLYREPLVRNGADRKLVGTAQRQDRHGRRHRRAFVGSARLFRSRRSRHPDRRRPAQLPARKGAGSLLRL